MRFGYASITALALLRVETVACEFSPSPIAWYRTVFISTISYHLANLRLSLSLFNISLIPYFPFFATSFSLSLPVLGAVRRQVQTMVCLPGWGLYK